MNDKLDDNANITAIKSETIAAEAEAHQDYLVQEILPFFFLCETRKNIY